MTSTADSEPLPVTQEEWARKIIHGTYYPHLDGLRCLAVVPVVFYHLAMALCPAGFMGVDVFFVISGYLICGGIVRDLERGTFSLVSFYQRRIRRIFPAYFALVLGVLGAGLVLYHWARVVPLAQTALFSALFSTNLYFWLDTGYFQPTAHGNPLLNLWSLGVEEHFYIVIPLLSLVLWKVRRGILGPVFGLGLLGSLAACLYLGHKGDSTTAFYLLPTRAWELLAGALLAMAPPPRALARGAWLALAGLALVLLSFWCFSTARTFGNAGTSAELILPWVGSLGLYPFPGLVNLPVIAGSLLLIRYGGSGLAGRLLCLPPLVGVGKVSYSLYLWHWPLIVLARYVTYDRQGPALSAGILAASALAAYLSWRYVEMPVRASAGFTPRVAFTATAGGCALLAGLSGLLIATHGLRDVLYRQANRFPSPPRAFLPNFRKLQRPPPFRPPPYPAVDPAWVEHVGDPHARPSFCLVGDSHAEALWPGLDAVAADRHRAGYYLHESMHPYLEAEAASRPQQLLRWAAADPDLQDFYLVGRWMKEYRVEEGLPRLGDAGHIAPTAFTPETAALAEANFRRTAEWLHQAGKKVFVFTCVPEYLYAPNDLMARSQLFPLPAPIALTAEDYRHRQAPIAQLFGRLGSEGVVTVIPLGETLLAGGTTVFMGEAGTPYYRDGDHLTPAGGRHAVEAIAPLLWPP